MFMSYHNNNCNIFSSDIEFIKEQAVWLEESQKYKLPDLVIPRTKLPPAGKFLCTKSSCFNRFFTYFDKKFVFLIKGVLKTYRRHQHVCSSKKPRMETL